MAANLKDYETNYSPFRNVGAAWNKTTQKYSFMKYKLLSYYNSNWRY